MVSDRVKVISYFTYNYSHLVEPYVLSLEKYNIDYRIEEYPDRGMWEENCAIKPQFISECLDEEEKNLFYCDIDAEFLKAPDWEEFENEERMGCCVAKLHPPKWELISSAIFLPNNEITKLIVKGWLTHQQHNPTQWDQVILAEVLNRIPDSEKNWFPMDLKYCGIDTLNIEDPVILQKQESRN